MCGRPPTILSMYQNQTTLWPLFDQHLPSYENNTDSIAVLKRQVPLSSADGLAAILKHERSKTSINLACKPRQGTSSPNSRRSHHHTRRVAVIESLLASETVKRNYTMQGFQNILSFDVLTTTGIKKTWRHIRASGADGFTHCKAMMLPLFEYFFPDVNVDFFTPQTVNEETLNQNDQFLAGRFKSVSLIRKKLVLWYSGILT